MSTGQTGSGGQRRFADADARISQALPKDLHHRTSSPCQNGRHQLGDDDLSLCSKYCKRGPKCEAHAQPADQYLRPLVGLNSLASNCRERLFGSADAAVH